MSNASTSNYEIIYVCQIDVRTPYSPEWWIELLIGLAPIVLAICVGFHLKFMTSTPYRTRDWFWAFVLLWLGSCLPAFVWAKYHPNFFCGGKITTNLYGTGIAGGLLLAMELIRSMKDRFTTAAGGAAMFNDRRSPGEEEEEGEGDVELGEANYTNYTASLNNPYFLHTANNQDHFNQIHHMLPPPSHLPSSPSRSSPFPSSPPLLPHRSSSSSFSSSSSASITNNNNGEGDYLPPSAPVSSVAAPAAI